MPLSNGLRVAALLVVAATLSACIHTRAETSSISRDTFRVHVATDGLGGNSGDVLDHAIYAGAKGALERGGRYFVLAAGTSDKDRIVTWAGTMVMTTDVYKGDYLIRLVGGPGAGVFDARDVIATMGERFEPKRPAAAAAPKTAT